MDKIEARKILINYAWILRKMNYSFEEFKNLIETEFSKTESIKEQEIYDAYWELQEELEHIKHWIWDHVRHRRRNRSF